MGGLASGWGIPPLAGPFLLSGAAYLLAALVLGTMLRPDPLRLACERAALAPDLTTANLPATGRASSQDRPRPGGVMLGASVMVLTQLVMVAVMTMTPVHMAAHGHSIGAAGAVIAVHVAAMYLPSPISGWLVDRYGRTVVAALAGITLLAAGVLAAAAPANSVVLLAVALALLGLGWNFGLVSGTAIITDSVALERRATTQGTVDVGIAVAVAGGGLASGAVMAATSYPALAIAGGVIAVAIIPIIGATVRSQRRSVPHTATEPGS